MFNCVQTVSINNCQLFVAGTIVPQFLWIRTNHLDTVLGPSDTNHQYPKKEPQLSTARRKAPFSWNAKFTCLTLHHWLSKLFNFMFQINMIGRGVQKNHFCSICLHFIWIFESLCLVWLDWGTSSNVWWQGEWTESSVRSLRWLECPEAISHDYALP